MGVTVVLLAVAAAASGRAPEFAGGAGVSAPGRAVGTWAVGIVAAVLALASAGVLVLLLRSLLRRRGDPEEPPHVVGPFPLSHLGAAAIAGLLVGLIALAVVVLLVVPGAHQHGLAGMPRGGGGSIASPGRMRAGGGGDDGALLIAAAIVGAVLAAGAGTWLWRRRRREAPTTRTARRPRTAATEPDELPAWELDPRAAVLQAYGVGERSLAGAGLARGGNETPREYLARVREDMTEPQPVVSLTALYEHARFAARPVHPAMRASAIQAAERLHAGIGRRAVRGPAVGAPHTGDRGDAPRPGGDEARPS